MVRCGVQFLFYPWRFWFVAREPIHFPEGKSGNVLRGAFGTAFRKTACAPSCRGAERCEQRQTCAYARIFEPRADGGAPSGLADLPRPFVFRARHLDGRTVSAGKRFHFDLNMFDTCDPLLAHFEAAFARMASEGLGPSRGRADLDSARQNDRGPVALEMSPDGAPVHRITVQFLTPTELKSRSGMVDQPEFRVLLARARDRVSTLRAIYGGGPLTLDFRAVGERASRIKMMRCDLRQVDAERRSSRTGQTHSIGGFIGEAEYEGDLGEFIPVLRAAQWTGVGRQTVWGKGAIQVVSHEQHL
jgi:hypothetical protein